MAWKQLMNLNIYRIMFLMILAIGIVGCAERAEPAEETEMPGFKFMVLLNKQEDISFEEYERYFFEEHLPYVLAIPGLRGYKVNLRHPDDNEALYDGISEFWFDDRDAFDRAMASPETEATLEDAAKFLMPPQIFLVDERNIIPLVR